MNRPQSQIGPMAPLAVSLYRFLMLGLCERKIQWLPCLDSTINLGGSDPCVVMCSFACHVPMYDSIYKGGYPGIDVFGHVLNLPIHVYLYATKETDQQSNIQAKTKLSASSKGRTDQRNVHEMKCGATTGLMCVVLQMHC